MTTTTAEHSQQSPKAGRPRHARRRGQSLVELAIALPLMLMILLGTVDVGRMFWSYIQMRNAAFQGVRYGMTAPSDTTGIQTRVTTHGVPSGTTVNVTCNSSTNVPIPGCQPINPGDNVTVTVTVSAQFSPIVTGFVRKYLGIGPFTMTAKATARVAT